MSAVVEPGAVAHAETLAGRVVEIEHPTLLVDDADEIRRTFDEREQLARHVRI